MSKTVDLNRIPKWEVGKWYVFKRTNPLKWQMLMNIDELQTECLEASDANFTKDGRFYKGDDFGRTLLEPWEALAMYPECKESAPDGVDWSEPESEPDGMPTPEASPLPENGISFEETVALATKEIFKKLYTAPMPNDLFEQNRALLARNSELEATCDRLQYFEAENKELREENKSLIKSYETVCDLLKEKTFDITTQNERLNELESDLAQAKILIAGWAIKLKYYGEL